MNPARANERRRVLLITRNLPPLVGGMERFNERAVEQLRHRFQIAVCGPAGCESFLPEGTESASVAIRPLGLFLARMFVKSLRLAFSFRPDIIVAGSGLVAPIALVVARCLRVPALSFLYGLDLVAPSFLYQQIWLPAIRANAGAIAISRFTRDLAIAKGLNAARIRLVHPGVDAPLDDIGDEAVRTFRQKYDLGKRPIILSVGRLTPRKGIGEFIRNSLPIIIERAHDAVFVVIGAEARDALAGKAPGAAEAVRDVAREMNLEAHVKLLGPISDEDVQAAYRAGQVHVFPVREQANDVEGFGIVALEAAIAGTPTVAFAAGGVPDAVAPGVSGELIPPNDYAAFADSVLRFLQNAETVWTPEKKAACIEFGARFRWDNIGIVLNDAIAELGAL